MTDTCACRFLTTSVQGAHWCCRLEGWNREMWFGKNFREIAHKEVQHLQQFQCQKRAE